MGRTCITTVIENLGVQPSLNLEFALRHTELIKHLNLSLVDSHTECRKSKVREPVADGVTKSAFSDVAEL